MTAKAPLLLLALLGAAITAPARAEGEDYPTIDRVRYVQACMRDHPGPTFEMTNKCVCVFDGLAREVRHDEFVAMSTAADANSIGGERGSYIRDTEMLQESIRRWRELQARMKKSCFLAP